MSLLDTSSRTPYALGTNKEAPRDAPMPVPWNGLQELPLMDSFGLFVCGTEVRLGVLFFHAWQYVILVLLCLFNL